MRLSLAPFESVTSTVTAYKLLVWLIASRIRLIRSGVAKLPTYTAYGRSDPPKNAFSPDAMLPLVAGCAYALEGSRKESLTLLPDESVVMSAGADTPKANN